MLAGSRSFCAIRSYLSIQCKQEPDGFDVRRLFEGNALLPSGDRSCFAACTLPPCGRLSP